LTLSSALTTNRQPEAAISSTPGVLEHVLDLCRAVKGQLRAAIVQGADDR